MSGSLPRRRVSTASIALVACSALATIALAAPPVTTPPAARAVPPEATRASAGAVWTLPGTFGNTTTFKTLVARYGAANVKVTQIDGAEGETSRGIELFGSDPSRRLELLMQDEATLHGVYMARALGTTSRWHLDNGVRPGMTLAQLVALNGKAIAFNGLEWDYGGVVADWRGGRLAQSRDAVPFRAVSLAAAADAPARSYPLGDGVYRSDDPAFPRQGQVLRVAEVSVVFAAP